MTNKIDDRAFRFTAHTIIVVFGRRTVGRFGGFCIVDVNVQNFLGYLRTRCLLHLSQILFVLCGSCSRLFALGAGWVTRDYMQQPCTFCHRNESCFSLPWLLLGGDINDFGQTCRALIIQCARQFQLHSGICGNSEFVLYIQCHQIHGLDTKGHQIRSTSRQPGTDTEKTRDRSTVNQSFELIHALLHLASP